MTTETEPKNNVSPEVISQAVSSLDRYILNHYDRPRRRTLREKQITVVEDLRDTLRGRQTEGYVTIPTGVGKTVLFVETTEALNEQQILETMIVVPTKILVNQTAERFQQFAPDLQVGKLYSDAHDITRPVTITTYASLVRHIEDGTLDAQLYKLLVLDEVHRSLSGKRSQAVAQFINAIKLGFTATPMYSEDKNVANLLNTEIHKMSIREAVEEDLLSPFSAIIAQTDVDLSNVSIKSSGDYDDKELEEAINIASRNQAAVDLYQRMFQGQTAVAYCISVRHAQAVAELFSEKGISAGYVSGYQDKKEQAEILKKYHQGEIKVLCNADILIEGFDEPRVSVCLNLRPTKSVVVAQQRGGRVLRLYPDNPNKHAVIVDFLDKTEDPRKLPVTFAEVAEAAFITTKRLGGDTTSPSIPKAPPGGRIDTGVGSEDDVITISGLKVIVNPQEVMRIVKEIQERILTVIQDTEIPITYNYLKSVFIGEGNKLMMIARRIMEKMRNYHLEEYQQLFVKRLSRVSASNNTREHLGFSIDACTNTEKFIQLMKEEGIYLRSEGIPLTLKDQELDFPLTYSNIAGQMGWNWSKFKTILEELKKKMERENPEEYGKLFALRRGKNNLLYEVCMDRGRLIGLLTARGLFESQISELDDKSEFNSQLCFLSNDYLRLLFRGTTNKLKTMVKMIKNKLKEENPEEYGKLFITTKRKGQTIEACTDKEVFIDLMLQQGAFLRQMDSSPQEETISVELGEEVILITKAFLTKLFRGNGTELRKIALNLLEESLRSENPDLISKRIIGTQHVMTYSNKQKFIEEMQNRGVRLKPTTN